MKPAINMLTLNGATNFLKYSLESVYDYCDEIRVYDTGSTDNTLELLAEYPKTIVKQFNVQHLGKVWSNSELDAELTRLLNQMKEETKATWILKIDDDEVFPPELMEEIIGLEDTGNIYTIPFLHIGSKNKSLRVKRLFHNISDVDWRGSYGLETLCYQGHRISSDKCPQLKNRFIHLGQLRKDMGDRIHNYNFSELI